MTIPKTWALVGLVIASLSVAACHRKDVSGSMVNPRPIKTEVVKPTLESLDVRVTALEYRLNAAKAARERAARDAAKLK